MVGSGFSGSDVVVDGGGAVPAGAVGEAGADAAVAGGGAANSCANPKSAIEIAANAELLSRIPLRTPHTTLRPHRAKRQRTNASMLTLSAFRSDCGAGAVLQ